MNLEGKVDEMNAMLHEMKPMLAASVRSLESLDIRQRAMEIKQAESDVRMGRLVSDFDGLGRKVRALSDRRKLQDAGAGEGTRWLSFLAALAAIPKYWVAITTIGGFVLTAAAILIQHWPRVSHAP